MTSPTNGNARGQKRKPLLIEPGAEPRPPRTPRDLGDVGRRAWKQVWLGGRRWLDVKSDALVVELVARTFDKVAEIERDLDEHGRYYFTKSGQELPRPGVADVRALRGQIVSWLALLGFSPSARSEMGHAATAKDDTLTEFRKRHRKSATLYSDASAEPRTSDTDCGAASD
jgi:P27 family predicted phage terminase small subunit